MNEQEFKNKIAELEGSISKYLTERDVIFHKTLNMTLSNQARLEVLIANQARIFEKFFPERSEEQHSADFKKDYEEYFNILSAEMISDMLKTKGEDNEQ